MRRKTLGLVLIGGGSALLLLPFFAPLEQTVGTLARWLLPAALLAPGAGLVAMGSGGGARSPCLACGGSFGEKEMNAGIAGWFPGPIPRQDLPAHNDCFQKAVAQWAQVPGFWERFKMLNPNLFNNGVAPPPDLSKEAGPATHGPPPPPPATGLTLEEENVLRVVRASSVPMSLSQVLLQAGLAKHKHHLVYGLQLKGHLSIKKGKFREMPTEVTIAPPQPAGPEGP